MVVKAKNAAHGKKLSNTLASLSLTAVTMLALLIALTIFLTLFKVQALSIVEIKITPSNVTTNNPMTCSWNVSDALGVNVSWINGSQVYDSLTNADSSGEFSIDENIVFRGETWTCQVIAWNATTTINESVNKTIQNAGPTTPVLYNESDIDQGNHTVLLEDHAYRFRVYSSDPENDDVDYVILTQNPFDSFDTETGDINWTPTVDDIGNHTVEFLSKDNQTPSALADATLVVVFEVLSVNDAPYFSPALTDQTAYENDCDWQYSITATDEETPNGPFNFSIVSVVPATYTPLELTKTSDNTAVLSFASCISFFDVGTHNVTLAVMEADNNSVNSTSSFILTIISVNHAPNITALNTTASSIQNGELFLYFNATDLDNDTINFSSTALNCTASIENPWVINQSQTQYNFDGNTSFAEAWLNFTSPNNLTNNHVICTGWVNITASDGKQTSHVLVFINVTNVNDDPVIHENSSYDVNTQNNHNIHNLTAFVDALFVYKVNASDVDMLTYQGDSLTFSTNDSRFPINATTGIISFMPNASLIGNHSFLVTVNDSYGSSTNTTAFISIHNNSAPRFLHNLTNQQAWEDINFEYDINATDDEDCPGSQDCVTYNISYYNVSSVESVANISINSQGVLQVQAVQSNIGIYNVTVTITDSYGARRNNSFLLYINNTNDCPTLSSITFPEPIVVGHEFSYIVYASDEDLSLPNSTENLSFYDNTTIFDIQKISNTSALIEFTPNASQAGNHSVKIWVNDSLNNAGCVCGGPSYRIVNFTIYNKTEPPVIQTLLVKILENNTVLLNWTNVTAASNVSISVQENVTLLFNHTGFNDEKPYQDLNFTWYFNGENVSTNYSMTKHFNFFSAGNHTIVLLVNDTMLESDNLTIFITVSNVNRPPQLLNDLYNLTGEYAVDPVFEDNDYFTGSALNPRFYDPDNESLTFSIYNSTCSGVAGITINGSQLTVTGVSIGTCLVVFKAVDPHNASLYSNTVLVNVTQILPETQVTTHTGGGSNTRTQTLPLPIPEEVEQPKPLEILTPGLVIVYKNETIKVPIHVRNTWGDKIYGVKLWTEVNVSDVKTWIENPYYAALNVNETRTTYLYVTNYRLGEHFEIKVLANVSEPVFEDTGLIVIASLEARSKAEESELLVTFARDLLSGNPECAELNELLYKAQDLIAGKEYDNALKLLDATIEGCRYLVSKHAKVEQPGQVMDKYLDFLVKHAKNVFIIVLSFAVAGLLILFASILQHRMIKKLSKTEKK